MARILIRLIAVITTVTFSDSADLMDSGCGNPRYQVGVSGSFSSMNYPNNYADNARCNWVIKVPTGYGIKIHFSKPFAIEEAAFCDDYVQINNGRRLCGTSAPEETYDTNKLDVKFLSNINGNEAGFQIEWKVAGCRGTYYPTRMSGSITSGNYPDEYPKEKDCGWFITVPDGFRIRLQFADPFELRGGSPCNYFDYISVKESQTQGFILKEHCGGKPNDINSTDNDVYIRWKAAWRRSSEKGGKGFSISWTAIEDRKTFGPKDEYTCHCKKNVQCDKTTGACPNRACGKDWSGDSCQEGNAAVGRPATQSSTYGSNTAGKAVDNDRSQLMWDGSCTHTAISPLDNQPWWRVDLGRKFSLISLTLYNRGNDGCETNAACDRLKNFVIWMTNIDDADPSKGETCVEHPGKVSLSLKPQLTCSTPAVGRYLYIKLLDSKTALSLCEVVIKAVQYKEPMPFMKRKPIASNVKDTSVTITTPAWINGTDVGDGIVIKYRLQYKLKSADQWSNDTTEHSASSITSSSWPVSGLSAGMIYQFRVVLLSRRPPDGEEKWGGPGSLLEVKTLCQDTPKIKEITTGIKLSDSWPNRAYLLVKVEAFRLSSSNCFQKYSVHFIPKGGSPKGLVWCRNLIYEKEVTNLMPVTEYDVYIKLWNKDERFSQSKTWTKKTAEDIPGPVTSPAAYSQGKTIRITWKVPTVKNGVITSYRIEHKLVGYGQCENVAGSTVVFSPDLKSTARSYDLPTNGLCPYCAYDITVRASTKAGRGNPYAFSRIFTAATVPTAAPPAPTLKSKESDQLVFSLPSMPCRDRKGPKGKYRYQLNKTADGIRLYHGEANYPTFTRRGLSPYTSYQFKIAYENEVGVGPYTGVVTEMTGEAAPGPVESISVKKSAPSVKVTWTLPAAPNGVIKHYIVHYKHLRYGKVTDGCPVTNPSWTRKEITSPVLEYTVNTCPYCLYDFKVQAVNGAGVGPEKVMNNALTPASAPTVGPPTPTASKTSRQITFTWAAMPCENRKGAFKSYVYKLASASTVIKTSEVQSTSVTLTQLIPYTTYGFQVAYRNQVRQGPYGSVVSVTTDEEVPRAPNITKAGAQLDSISVKVIPPDPPHGNITKYTIEMWLKGTTDKVTSVSLTAPETLKTFTKLTIDSTYIFRAKALTSKGAGEWSAEISIRTVEDIPGPPGPIQVVETTVRSLKITWSAPEFPNGVLKNYKLICAPVFSYDAGVNGNKDKHIVKSEPTPTSVEKTFTGLTPATEYNCSIRAQTAIGYGPAVSVRNWTRSQRDDISTAGDSAVTVKKISPTTITIDIKELPKNAVKSGKLEAIRIGVKYGSAKKNRRKRATSLTSTEHTELTGVEDATKNGRTSYIAAELDPDFKGRFVIGDNKTYGGYYNPPLKTGETYYVLYGIVTNAGGFESVMFIRLDKGHTLVAEKGDGTNLGVAVGVPIAILIISAAVITAVVLIIRKRRSEKPPAPSSSSHNIELEPVLDCIDGPDVSVTQEADAEPVGIDLPVDIDHHSIPCSGLLQHNIEIRGEKFADFEAEFKTLPADMVKPHEVALANKPLNRYQNIIAYDHSRVILKPTGDILHDYVNANYVDGYDKDKVFIASQGPKEEHVVDMWRLIWQQRCPAIVMLTQFREGNRAKCVRYWPETTPGKATYGPFEVELVREEHFTDYVKRTLKISLEGKFHHVTHYHFTAWPDHGVPKFASSLLNLRTIVMKHCGKHYGKRPLLVHCSAGVGRTGTFIAIDYLIREGEAENKVNIYGCVEKLRGFRPNMIQNVNQYQHVHDAMAEYFLVGITTCDTEVYRDEYLKLIKVKPGESKCKLQEQFSHLAAFVNTITPSTDALTVHADKNRSPDIVPSGSSRPILTQPVAGWDDYINAVYLSGYGDKDTYIATQHPLPNTVKDFWRLVEDMGLSTVVMMNVIKEGNQLCPVFWPEEGKSMEVGPLVVEGKNTDASHPEIVIRDFEILRRTKFTDGNPARQVRQFHLQNWPDGRATPKTASSIVELIEMVRLWQQQTGSKKILVQCLDGASQSGVFCLAHSVIEKVKVDHEVDVFQYARLLRTNRPQLFNTYEQYKFVHDVILEYLSQFDTYANFQGAV